jgi:Protein of unknown function (DUF1501)
MCPRIASGDRSCPEFRGAGLWNRRELLRAGSLGVFGLGLPQMLAAHAGSGSSAAGKAKACIVLFMWGGPSQLDTWDPKPDAPDEIRGDFKTIATRVPGIRISEHFPLLARHADKYTIIRSMTHDDAAHLSSVHHVLTGQHAPKVKSDAEPPSRRDSPHVGSVLAYRQQSRQVLPAFVTLPWTVSHPAAPGGLAPGQNAGWLGQAHDPFVLVGDPNTGAFHVDGLARAADVSMARLADRQRLLTQVDRLPSGAGSYGNLQQRALALLSSPSARRAFALDQEPAALRDRYGRNIYGQGLLMARRLIEAGVRLVEVNWHQDRQNFWDTHGDNFNRLKRDLMPPADRAFAALLEDLTQRGLLDDTLIVWVGEFGRTPVITRGNAGREHHPWCYSAVLAGGGIRGGHVHGKSDRHAAYPAENPVSPADLTATIYHALGIAPDSTIADREGRLLRLTEGEPVLPLFF